MWAVWIAVSVVVLAVLFVLAVGIATMHVAVVRQGPTDFLAEDAKVAIVTDAEALQKLRAAQADLRARPAREMTIKSFDGLRLYGRLYTAEGEKTRGTVLLMHGYRSQGDCDFCLGCRQYLELGYDVLIADQRAHGKSEGRYIGFGVPERLDCLAWVKALCADGATAPLFLGGLSMGASTVLLAGGEALPPQVRGIIADCGFTSPGEIIRKVMRDRGIPQRVIYPVFRVFCRVFARYDPDAFSTLDAVRRCSVPILFVHGTDDDFVPCEMTKQAYEACTSPKTLLLVQGAHHAMSFATDPVRYRAAVQTFLTENGQDTETGV